MTWNKVKRMLLAALVAFVAYDECYGFDYQANLESEIKAIRHATTLELCEFGCGAKVEAAWHTASKAYPKTLCSEKLWKRLRAEQTRCEKRCQEAR